MVGYSGTPLATKLGIKAGMTVAALHAPDDLAEWLKPLPDGVVIVAFVTESAHLTKAWPKLTAVAGDGGMVWVCWPKKASKVSTDMTEDVVRAVALPTGWVDIKVCAVSDVWSGLKCVLRKELRSPQDVTRKTRRR